MSNQQLTENYIYACTKRLPRRYREDIAKELGTLIDDMLAERCGDLPPSEKDLRVVLTEIGTPMEVHSKYAPHPDRALIGPPYYTHYIFILQIVLCCVAFGLTVAHIIGGMAGAYAFDIAGVFTWLASLFGGGLFAFTFVTLLFAFFSYRGVSIFEFSNLNDLPPAPKRSVHIPRWESIAGMVMTAVFLLIFIAIPQIIALYYNGVSTPFFNLTVLREKWIYFLLFGAISITNEALRLIDRRYTTRVMLWGVGGNIASAFLAVLIFADGRIVNPAFGTALSGFIGDNGFVTSMFTRFHLFFVGVILFALVLETSETLYRYFRGKV